MPGRRTAFEEMAHRAAERIERHNVLGTQLSLAIDEAGNAPMPLDDAKGRGKGKALSQFRQFLKAQGFELPEKLVARMAGLDQGGDPLLMSMMDAERILLWAGDGAKQVLYTQKEGQKVVLDPKTGEALPWEPTPEQKLAVFERIHAMRLKALEALLPYGLAKMSTDERPVNATQVIVQSGQTGEASARVVQAQPGDRMAPPPLPAEMPRNQWDTQPGEGSSDASARTESSND